MRIRRDGCSGVGQFDFGPYIPDHHPRDLEQKIRETCQEEKKGHGGNISGGNAGIEVVLEQAGLLGRGSGGRVSGDSMFWSLLLRMRCFC